MFEQFVKRPFHLALYRNGPYAEERGRFLARLVQEGRCLSRLKGINWLREKASGGRDLFQFSKPQDETYPVMLEIFSRKPEGIDLDEGRHVIPITFVKLFRIRRHDFDLPEFSLATHLPRIVPAIDFAIRRARLIMVLMKPSGMTDLPLHGGRVSEWFAQRMTALGTARCRWSANLSKRHRRAIRIIC